MDVAGDNQVNIDHDIVKQRLSKFGYPIGKPKKSDQLGKVKVQLMLIILN
jgi:hypothetical protein